MADATITRPTPVWQKRLDWRWPRTARTLIVKASFAADTDPEYADVLSELPPKIPNNITLLQGGEELRLTREAAELLRDALTEALGWDGK
jgi:hypothetical protein